MKNITRVIVGTGLIIFGIIQVARAGPGGSGYPGSNNPPIVSHHPYVAVDSGVAD